MCVKLFVKVVMGAGVHFHVAFKKKNLWYPRMRLKAFNFAHMKALYSAIYRAFQCHSHEDLVTVL